jgi:hypothetical protein
VLSARVFPDDGDVAAMTEMSAIKSFESVLISSKAKSSVHCLMFV